MGKLTDEEIDAALKKGRIAASLEPRASNVRYDRQTGRIVVDLSNTCVFAFPVSVAQGLEDGTDEQLAAVEILGDGYGLRWEALDVDLSIHGLLAGVFGTASYMARNAGRATSPSKAAAARSNGAKGGRPRKSVA